MFARTAAAWLATIGWAVVLLLATYLWVVRTGVAFEEAAVRKSERLAAQRAARRTRGSFALKASRPWFGLAPTGRPAVAIAWKNMVAFQRLLPITRVTLIVLLVVVVVAGSTPGMHLGWEVLRFAALGLAAMLTFLGPLYVRTDLHQDMLMLSLLRSYPLSGFSIVAAEIGGTLAVLTVMQVCLLLIGSSALVQSAGAARLAAARHRGACSPIPAVTALRVAVANAWVVLLPGWVHLGAGRPAGIEALGQNLVSILGSMIAHLLLLIGPAVAAFVTERLFAGELGHWAYVPAAMAGAFFAAVELWGIIGWLGAGADAHRSIGGRGGRVLSRLYFAVTMSGSSVRTIASSWFRSLRPTPNLSSDAFRRRTARCQSAGVMFSFACASFMLWPTYTQGPPVAAQSWSTTIWRMRCNSGFSSPAKNGASVLSLSMRPMKSSVSAAIAS